MTLELILVLALLTYGSRVLGLALLPTMPTAIRAMLDRVPAALFAGLAAHSLIVPGVGLVAWPIVIAAIGALVAAPLRSLPACLGAGAIGYVIGLLFFGVARPL